MKTTIWSIPVKAMEKMKMMMIYRHGHNFTSHQIKLLYSSSTSNPKSIFRVPRRFNNLKSTLIFFDYMIQLRPLPCILHFIQLFDIIMNMKHYSTVFSLCKRLQSVVSVTVSDLYIHSIMLNCLSHLNRVDLGFSLLAKIFKLGFTPNAMLLTTLVKGLCFRGRVFEAVDFVQDMYCKGYRPDEVTYGTIINGMCKCGNSRAALVLLRTMEEGGFCKPGVQHYSIVIDGLCKDMLLKEAIDLFDVMIAKGVQPNVVTYTCLIHCTCKLRDWGATQTLLKEMEDRKILPTSYIFTIFVDALWREGMIGEADALSREGMIGEAERLVEEMLRRGLKPDTVTYSTLIDGYCMHGRLDSALKVFELMPSQGCKPYVYTYNILINGYCKFQKLEDAMSLFEEMMNEYLIPNIVTYNILIGGLCRVGRTRDAQELFIGIQEYGFVPNLVTYATLLDGLFKNQQVTEALLLFQTVEDKNLDLDIVIISILIDGLCKNGKIKKARAIFDRLPSKGFQPDVQIYNIMINGFCKAGMLNSAIKLLSEMRMRGCAPNVHTYTAIIHAFLVHKDTVGAFGLLQEMVDRGLSSTDGQDRFVTYLRRKFASS